MGVRCRYGGDDGARYEDSRSLTTARGNRFGDGHPLACVRQISAPFHWLAGGPSRSTPASFRFKHEIYFVHTFPPKSSLAALLEESDHDHPARELEPAVRRLQRVGIEVHARRTSASALFHVKFADLAFACPSDDDD